MKDIPTSNKHDTLHIFNHEDTAGHMDEYDTGICIYGTIDKYSTKWAKLTVWLSPTELQYFIEKLEERRQELIYQNDKNKEQNENKTAT